MNALPPFQYSLDFPLLNMTKVEKNRVIRTDIINLENKITWISPKIPLGTKMAHYKTHFLHTSEDGFIIRTPYTRSRHSRERTRIRTWIGDRRCCQPNLHRCSRLTARMYRSDIAVPGPCCHLCTEVRIAHTKGAPQLVAP